MEFGLNATYSRERVWPAAADAGAAPRLPYRCPSVGVSVQRVYDDDDERPIGTDPVARLDQSPAERVHSLRPRSEVVGLRDRPASTRVHHGLVQLTGVQQTTLQSVTDDVTVDKVVQRGQRTDGRRPDQRGQYHRQRTDGRRLRNQSGK